MAASATIPGWNWRTGIAWSWTIRVGRRPLRSTRRRRLPRRRWWSPTGSFVKDRPGHDRRYAMDIAKIERELGWRPRETFASGLRKTVRWYLDNLEWVEHVTSGSYREWINLQYSPSSRAGVSNQ